MELLPNEVLDDPTYRVPVASPASGGMGWLRAQVVRFCEDDDHERRRELTEAVIGAIGKPDHAGSPTRTLLTTLGLSPDLEADVALVAQAYQPHARQSAEADAAADRLVAACGGRSEAPAARVCVLVQAHAGIPALIEVRRTSADRPPLPATRRIAPDGREVDVDLTGAPFGRGRHRCPGEQLAQHLADQALQRDS